MRDYGEIMLSQRAIVFGILLALFGGSLLTPAAGQSDVAEKAAASDDAGDEPQPPKAQKRDVDAVVVLLVLTVMVIILAFAGLLIWGRRVRRLAKQDLRPVPHPDPLWYLKSKEPRQDAEE